jgi:hypothetical protein
VAAYTSTYLLSLFNRLAGRPSGIGATDTITDASKYDRLTESQDALVELIAAIAPYALYPKVAYGSMPTCTTVDTQVFTFGLDSNGDPITPLGHTGIYPSLTAIPSFPWREGIDYLNEGTQIRIPNNGTYAGTLYWRGITPPPVISAVSQPVLLPVSDRKLIVLHAAIGFASEYDRNPGLAASLQGQFDARFARWCLVLKTQFREGGALGNWSGLTLATLSQV